MLERRRSLKIEELKPYDLDVDSALKPALKPFSSVRELITKSIACFSEIDPDFGKFIEIMDENGHLDLDSRKSKAPGGYNYPLYESNVPFIFMNTTNNLRDLETMMHEGGHAVHSFLSKNLPLVYYKEIPAEIAELASMSMELISMEHWHHFFPDEEELKRAKRSQLEGVIQVLPWVAAIDSFQHWIYTHPDHSEAELLRQWMETEKRFSSEYINWEGYENFRTYSWQKQIHLFQFPLYYIEYGIAQLGAMAIWKHYVEDREKTMKSFKKALSLGYSCTLPELYRAAGINFDFNRDYILELMDFVRFRLEGFK
jgi:oligoendopeptidase F